MAGMMSNVWDVHVLQKSLVYVRTMTALFLTATGMSRFFRVRSKTGSLELMHGTRYPSRMLKTNSHQRLKDAGHNRLTPMACTFNSTLSESGKELVVCP